MPVLPDLAARAARSGAIDTRYFDSRQLRNVARQATQRLAGQASQLLQTASKLWRRRDTHCTTGVIAECYAGEDSGPAPGAVAGIVLGSVAGFIVLLYILWILSQGTDFIRTSAVEEEEVVIRRNPRSRRSHRSTYREEMRERSPRRDRVIRQERIIRDRVDSAPPPPRESSRIRETVIIEERPERRVEGDDIVEVIEEHSSISGAPPPRRKSRRESGYR